MLVVGVLIGLAGGAAKGAPATSYVDEWTVVRPYVSVEPLGDPNGRGPSSVTASLVDGRTLTVRYAMEAFPHEDGLLKLPIARTDADHVSDIGHGWGEPVPQLMASGDYLVVIGVGNNAEWFDDTTYASRRGAANATLEYDGETSTYTYTWNSKSGKVEQYVFDSDGKLEKHIDTLGVTTTVVYSGGNLSTVTRKLDSSNNWSALEYDYTSGKIDHVAVGRTTDGGTNWDYVRRVKLYYYTSDVTGKGLTGDLKRVEIQMPSTADPDPDTDGNWTTTEVTYFRYHTEDSVENGKLPRRLKMILEPAWYHKMRVDSAVANPGALDGVTDSVLLDADAGTSGYQPYVTYYYTYVDSDETTPFDFDKIVARSKGTVGGGTFDCTEETVASSNAMDPYTSNYLYNAWKYKAVVEIDNGTVQQRTTQWMNHFGQVMLAYTEGPDDLNREWAAFYHYGDADVDHAGLIEWVAERSAIDVSYLSSLDGTRLGLLSANTGTDPDYDPGTSYDKIYDAAGLIRVYRYGDSTDATLLATAGDVEGYLQTTGLANGEDYIDWDGETDKPLLLRDYLYYSNASTDGTENGDNPRVFVIGKVTAYAEELTTADATKALVTTYAYDWQADASSKNTQFVEEKTINIPAYEGSAPSALTTLQVFDAYGRLTWHRGAAGLTDYYDYDTATGWLNKIIRDADLTRTGDFNDSVPGDPTWSTVNYGGLHLVTDYAYDDLGRVTEILGPRHRIDSPSSPMTWMAARTATWMVYTENDAESFNERWTATGWKHVSDANPANHTWRGIVGPITVEKLCKLDRAVETMTIVSIEGGGYPYSDANTDEKLNDGDTITLGINGTPTNNEDKRSWSRVSFDYNGLTGSRKAYHAIPGSDGYGALETNYYENAYMYEDLGRIERRAEKFTGGQLYTHYFYGVHNPDETSNYFAETRVYPPIEQQGQSWAASAPVSVTWVNEDGQLIRRSSADPAMAGVTPTGAETLTEKARTAYLYNQVRGYCYTGTEWRDRLGAVRKYYNLAGVGWDDEVASGKTGADHYNESKILAYDNLGRVLATEDPLGTIAAKLYPHSGLNEIKSQTLIGTDADGAERTNPGGGEALLGGGNDLVVTCECVCEEGSPMMMGGGSGVGTGSSGSGASSYPSFQVGKGSVVVGLDGGSGFSPTAPGGAAAMDGPTGTPTPYVRESRSLDAAGSMFSVTNTPYPGGLDLEENNPGGLTFNTRFEKRATPVFQFDGGWLGKLWARWNDGVLPNRHTIFIAPGTEALTGHENIYGPGQRVIAQVKTRGATFGWPDPRSGIIGNITATTNVSYDDAGRAYKIELPAGGITKTYWYDNGQIERRIICSAVGGLEDGSEGDHAGDTIEQEVVYVYDMVGRLAETITYRRDEDAEITGLLSADASGNAQVSYVYTWYDSVHRLTNIADLGVRTSAPTRTTPLLPNTSDDHIATEYSYDSAGRLETVEDNLARITKKIYDDAGRVLYVVENHDDFAYTAGGAPPHAGVGGGTNNDKDRVTRRAYNALSQVTERALLLTNSTEQLTTYIYGVDTTSAVKRNDFLLKIVYPDGSSGGTDNVTFTYRPNGAVRTRTGQRGVEITYTYDVFSRLADEEADFTGVAAGDLKWIDQTVTKLSYVQNGYDRVIKFTTHSSAGVLNEVQRDYATGWEDRLIESHQDHDGVVSSSPSVQYGVKMTQNGPFWWPDPVDDFRPTDMTYPNDRVVEFDYGTADQVNDVLSRIESIQPTSGSAYAEYTYMGAGTIVNIAHPAVSGGLNLTYGTSGNNYDGRDKFGRTVDQLWENTAGTDKDNFTYTYDRGSNRMSRLIGPNMSPATGKDHVYAYDELNRLQEFHYGTATGSPPAITSGANRLLGKLWGLSASGNWDDFDIDTDGDDDYTQAVDIQQARTHNDANEITAISESGGDPVWLDPVQDLAGNMTFAPMPGDEATAANGRWCVYDAWNRLVEVYADTDGDGEFDTDGTDVLIVEYRYDASHRRITKLIFHDNGEDPDTWDRTDYYYSAAWQVLSEYYEADVADADKDDVVTDLKYEYIWGIRYIDAPIVRYAASEYLYYTQDANFNVTALIDATDGAVVERYEYDPYGQVTVLDPDFTDDADGLSDFANQLLYAGYRYDPETGFYHVRNRMYHPTLGRFLQRDPAGYTDGMSLYEYVMGRPIGLVDPMGLGVNWFVYGWLRVGDELTGNETNNAQTYVEKEWEAEMLREQADDFEAAGTEELATEFNNEALTLEAEAAEMALSVVDDIEYIDDSAVIGLQFCGEAAALHMVDLGASEYADEEWYEAERIIAQGSITCLYLAAGLAAAGGPEGAPEGPDAQDDTPAPADGGGGAPEEPEGTPDAAKKPDTGSPGSARNPDGTPKTTGEQLEQLEEAQRRGRQGRGEEIDSTKKARQRDSHRREQIRDAQDAEDYEYGEEQ